MGLINWSHSTPITVTTSSVPKSPMSISKAASVDSLSAQIDTTTPDSSPSGSSEEEQPLALEAVPRLGAVDSLRKALATSIPSAVPVSRKQKLETSLYETEDCLSRIEEEDGRSSQDPEALMETPAWNDLPPTPLSMAVDASADDVRTPDTSDPTSSLDFALYGRVIKESLTTSVMPIVQSTPDFPIGGHEAAPMTFSKADHLPRLVHHGSTRTKRSSIEQIETPRIEVSSPKNSISGYGKERRTFMGSSSNLSDPFHDSQGLGNISHSESPNTPAMVTPPQSSRRYLGRHSEGDPYDGPANENDDGVEPGADQGDEESLDGCYVSECHANKQPLYLDYFSTVPHPEATVNDTSATTGTKIPSTENRDPQPASETLSTHDVVGQPVDQTPPTENVLLDYSQMKAPPKESFPLDYSQAKTPPKENLLLDYSQMQGASKEPQSAKTEGASLPFSQPTDATGIESPPPRPTKARKSKARTRTSAANKGVRKARSVLLRKPILAAIVGRQLAGPTKEKLKLAASGSEATESAPVQAATPV
jgi:hypothetical protein